MPVGSSHEYTGGCSVHWRDTMGTPGDFCVNEKDHYQMSRIFVLSPFATMQLYMLAFGTSESLLKFLYQVARAQSLTHFFVSSLIKVFSFKMPIMYAGR